MVLHEPSSEEDSRDEHEPAIEDAADRYSHQCTEYADAAPLLSGQAQMLPMISRRPSSGRRPAEPESDRSTPVLHRQRQVPQLESIDEAL